MQKVGTNMDTIQFFNDWRKSLKARCLLEAAVGIEPTNEAFAEPCLKPLGYAAALKGMRDEG